MNSSAELMNSVLRQDGVYETAVQGLYSTDVSGVLFYKESRNLPPTPNYYSKGIIIVGQGQKSLYVEDQHLCFEENDYVVFSMPMPVTCAISASNERPHISLIIDFDLHDLRHVIETMDHHLNVANFESDKHQPGIIASTMSESMIDTCHRLLKVLHSPVESALFGNGLIKELLYRILTHEDASTLFALSDKKSNLSRVEKAVNYIHKHYSDAISIDDLAHIVNMSNSAFFRAFKDVTKTTPIQYIKNTRLNTARNLILGQKLRVNEVARQVGYESVPQFSREFKRYYGVSPSEHLKSKF